MIANERQYKITTSELKKFRESIERARAEGAQERDPLIHAAMMAGMVSQANELEKSLERYTALKNGSITSREACDLSQIGVALIEARIGACLTQRDLAERVGRKEQQVQRWEATNYEGTSLRVVGEIIKALGVTVTGSTVRFASDDSTSAGETAAEKHELLVGTKVKVVLKEAGCDSEGDVVEELNSWVEWLLKQSISHAKGQARHRVTPADIASAMAGKVGPG